MGPVSSAVDRTKSRNTTPKRSKKYTQGYDATVTDKRRRAPKTDVKSEDDHLIAADRRKLVSTTRDLRRNYTLAAWAIRKHLDYVASHSFQSKNGNDALDTQIEKLVKWWSLPQNFDVAARHGLHRFTRLAEASRVVDGDILIYKLRRGLLQAIEGDRIDNNNRGEHIWIDRVDMSEYKRGVKCDKNGRALSYIVNNRSATGNRLVFDRILQARHVIHFGYYDRFDQVRGISPLAAGINSFQDTYEGVTYALARAKVAQLFALALKRQSAEDIGDVTKSVSSAGETDKSETTINFGKGPLFLDLEPEDDAQFLESRQPATEFQAFTEAIMALSLKALDIPFSFYNESFTNYSGARQALLMYEQSAKEKRKDVQALLDSLTAWRISLWVLGGVLELPEGMTVSDLEWEWIPSGLPWIDPLKETEADVRAVKGKFNSRRRILRRMGLDWNEVINEIDEEEKEIQRRGLAEVASTGNAGSNSNGKG